jgi:hypothetical protein
MSRGIWVHRLSVELSRRFGLLMGMSLIIGLLLAHGAGNLLTVVEGRPSVWRGERERVELCSRDLLVETRSLTLLVSYRRRSPTLHILRR